MFSCGSLRQSDTLVVFSSSKFRDSRNFDKLCSLFVARRLLFERLDKKKIEKVNSQGLTLFHVVSFLPSFLFCRQPWGVGLCPVYYAPCGCTAANCGMINAVIGLGIFFVLSQQVLFLDRFCNWMQLANFKIWLSAAYCGEVLMAAELQYRAMDVGYKVSYPHFTQTSHEEGLPETSWWQCKLWTHTKLISMV